MALSCIAVPLACALAFPFATLAFKRAMDGGRRTWSVMFLSNCAAALVFVPWLAAGGAPSWETAWQPLLGGLFFLAGQAAAFQSFRGELSIAIPVQGAKVLMVAFLATFALGQEIGPRIWAAALLSVAAIRILQEPDRDGGKRKDRARTLILSVAAALAFAAFDVAVQKWSREWGGNRYGAWAFAAQAALSLPLLLLPRARPAALPRALRAWAAAGALGMAAITLGLIMTIGACADATLVNLLFNSRSVWGVAAVWLAGIWSGNHEPEGGRRTLAIRLCGAAMMTGAVALALH